MTYPVYRLFISIVCLLVAGLLYWVLGRTRLGMMIRAGDSNREMISSLGIDINRLYRIVFALGVALAAQAGALAATISLVFPGLGTTILLLCFVFVVLGGKVGRVSVYGKVL